MMYMNKFIFLIVPISIILEINEIHKVKQYGKNDFWFQEYSFLGRDDSQYNIYTYKDSGFTIIHLNDYCTDFEYLDRDNFVVLCL